MVIFCFNKCETRGDKLNNATEKVNQILKENGVLEDFELEE